MASRIALALALAAILGLGLVAISHAQGPAASARAGPVPPPSPPPFHWTLPVETLPVKATPPADLPDLSVQWIQRTPHYQRYCLNYERGLPELCPGTANVPRFPSPGEVVTLTAVIANQGTLTSTAVGALWTIAPNPGELSSPGKLRSLSATLPDLGPGITTTLAITWAWTSYPSKFALTLDPEATLEEVTRTNNTRIHQSDALYLEILVHPLVVSAFAERPNLVGSWSFYDWIQAQFEAMNTNLASSSYGIAPQGVLDRVRIDRIQVTEDVGGDIVTSTLEFDGRWTFRVARDDPDTPEHEGQRSAERYAQIFAGTIDWGLIHELAHQLGVIDLYQLNVAASFQNQVQDREGLPLLVGFQWPNPGLMGGGDRHEHPWYRFSNHTARALNGNQGRRRGYYGEYLFDLPEKSSLRVLDRNGNAVVGATIQLYQTSGGVAQPTAVASGTTDAHGLFILPSRPVALGSLTTATGHTLSPNPFGTVDVVGWNGQFLVQISQDSQDSYTWWPITDFNMAAWQGTTTYERTVHTHLPDSMAPAAPAQLDGQINGIRVTLDWPASSDPRVVAYRIYRGQEPTFYPLIPVASTTATEYAGISTATARYAITAVDSQGNESGFSPLFRAQRTVTPVGVAVDPNTAWRTVLDRHDGALISQLPDDRWIGRQGSVHLGLTSGEALTRNDQGQFLVAVTNQDRLSILNPQLGQINWLGREEFVTGTLAGPAGIVSAGEPFSIAQRPIADHHTAGLARFDVDTLLSGDPPVQQSGVQWVPGRFGNAIHIDDGDRLVYNASEHWDSSAGSLQFWVRPDWSWNDGKEHVLVEAGHPTTPGPEGETAAPTCPGSNPGCPPAYRMRLAKADWDGLYAWLTDGAHDIVLYGSLAGWSAFSWHHLALAWQPVQPDTQYRRYTLWVDGRLEDSQVLRRPVSGQPALLSVGTGLEGRDGAAASLDELHISSVARVGNSQSARLVVSQSRAQRVDVIDWLGHTVSSLDASTDPSFTFEDPREIVWLTDRLAVADAAAGRVVLLEFDGSHLVPTALWTSGLVYPLALAAMPDGGLLVSDTGDHQVKLLDSQGQLLRRWSHPTDGHLGSFRRPAGLAILPDGSAVVTDSGNGRVVRLAAPLAAPTIYFPSVSRESSR